MTLEPPHAGKGRPASPPPAPADAPTTAVPDPMAVHRDPSRTLSTSRGTMASRARVHADYQWLRLADLGVLAGQGAIGRGISLEREVLHRTRQLPARAVSAARRRSPGTTPPAPPASTSPAATGPADGVLL